MLVCHLIDATDRHRLRAWPTTFAMMADAVSAARQDNIETCVVLIGPSALRAMAIESGLSPDAVISAPQGVALGRWLNVRHKLPKRAQQADMVHAWSLNAAVLAKKFLKPAQLCITITEPPDASDQRHIAQLAHEKHIGWLPINPTYGRTLLTLGCRGTQIFTLRPAIDPDRLALGQSQRVARRQSWGITDHADAPAVTVVALLSDPPMGPSSADTIIATMAVSLAGDGIEMYYPNLRLGVHPMQARRQRAETSMRELGCPDRVMQIPELTRPWLALPACDLAIVCGSPEANDRGEVRDENSGATNGGTSESTVGGKSEGGSGRGYVGRYGGRYGGESGGGCGGKCGGGASLVWAMGAGLPIVGQAVPEIEAVVRDEHSALLSVPGEPRFLGHGLRRLLDDRALAQRLRDNAQADVQSRHSLPQFRRQLLNLYRQLTAGEPIIDHPLS